MYFCSALGAPAPLLAICGFATAAHRNSACAVPTTPSCSSICATVAGTKGCPPSSFGKFAPCNGLVAALSGQPLDAITAVRASVIAKGSSIPSLTTQIPSTLRYAHNFDKDVDGSHILVSCLCFWVAEMAKGQHEHLPDLCTCQILQAFNFIL
jgi:hypothetical protein